MSQFSIRFKAVHFETKSLQNLYPGQMLMRFNQAFETFPQSGALSLEK